VTTPDFLNCGYCGHPLRNHVGSLNQRIVRCPDCPNLACDTRINTPTPGGKP
jgi:hypothetical protein